MKKKDEKTAPPAAGPPAALKTEVGVPSLPSHPPDDHIEVLSGSLLLGDLPMVRPPPRRPASSATRRGLSVKSWLLFIAFAGVAGAGSVLFVARLRHHSHPVERPRAFAAQLAAQPSASLSAPVKVSSSAPVILACAVAGEPHVIAKSALVAVGLEARSFGSDIALGFAPDDHQAVLARLDPSSLSISESTTSHTAYPTRHVTPVPGRGGRLRLSVDVDRPGDPLQSRRTLPIDPPLQIGIADDDSLAWAPLDRGIQGKLWPTDGHGEGALEALRGARSESNLATVAIAYRRAGAVWVGTAETTKTLSPKGDLRRIAGLGSTVGSPAIAVDEGVVIVAWADRATLSDPWQLRWTHFKPGDAPAAPATFVPPPGGKGHEAMSPALAVLPGQRFLLVWTEGPPNDRDVRAMTLSVDGTAVGAPLNISNRGVNAGQGQAAVTASGRGVVAFLESFEQGFRVAATPIACPL